MKTVGSIDKSQIRGSFGRQALGASQFDTRRTHRQDEGPGKRDQRAPQCFGKFKNGSITCPAIEGFKT